MEKINSIEEISKNIAIELKRAEQNAISLEKVNKIIDRIETLEPNTLNETNPEILNLKEKLNNSTVTVHTLTEFKLLIEKTTSDKNQIEHLLSHENAHANVAEIVGAVHGGYSLLVCKNENGFYYIPSTNLVYPDGWDTKEKLKLKLKIFEAPKEYGNRISNRDQQTIDKIRKELIE